MKFLFSKIKQPPYVSDEARKKILTKVEEENCRIIVLNELNIKIARIRKERLEGAVVSTIETLRPELTKKIEAEEKLIDEWGGSIKDMELGLDVIRKEIKRLN